MKLSVLDLQRCEWKAFIDSIKQQNPNDLREKSIKFSQLFRNSVLEAWPCWHWSSLSLNWFQDPSFLNCFQDSSLNFFQDYSLNCFVDSSLVVEKRSVWVEGSCRHMELGKKKSSMDLWLDYRPHISIKKPDHIYQSLDLCCEVCSSPRWRSHSSCVQTLSSQTPPAGEVCQSRQKRTTIDMGECILE